MHVDVKFDNILINVEVESLISHENSLICLNLGIRLTPPINLTHF